MTLPKFIYLRALICTLLYHEPIHIPTSKETERLIFQAREDIKTLFNAGDCEVAFGPNATTIMSD